MMRIGLSVYLILVTLAGPALCCCSLRGLTKFATQPADRAGRQTSAEPPPATPPEDGGCCCCHHQKPAPTPKPPKSDDPPLRQPTDPCPCRHHASQPALPSSQADSAAPWLFSPVFLALLSFAPVALAGSVADGLTGAAVSSAGRPFLTAQDMLRAHHLLRC
jgi:hypothetical protein